jgi:hypothetical protein
MDLTVIPNTEASTVPGITPVDLSVMHGQLRVGRIRSDGTRTPGAKFIWILSTYDSPDGMRRSGVAATIEDARAALKDSWQQWLAWAGLSEREPVAHEASHPAADSRNDKTDDELFAAVLREAHLAARGGGK